MNSDAYKLKLLEETKGLVTAVAGRYRDPLDRQALLEAGQRMLERTAEQYDPNGGEPFSKVAVRAVSWAMRQEVTRQIADSRPEEERIPVWQVEAAHRLLKTARQLARQLGRRPSIEELAEAADSSPEQVEELLQVTAKITAEGSK